MPATPSHFGPDLGPADLAALEDLAVRAAVQAGRFIVDERPGQLVVADTKSSVNDVVTVMDRRSEALLRSLLLGERPDDAVLGEEGGAERGTSGVTWVIDPIDGTVNYLYQIPAYCVSVAAVLGDPSTPGAWTPVAGAVCNPLTCEVFHAHQGGGAWCTVADQVRMPPRPLAVTRTESLLGSLMATGFGYRPEMRAQQGMLIAALLPEIRDIRRAGSAALDLCSVAAGRLDAYYEKGLNPWDLAAGWLVAAEAGAVVSGLHGRAPSADGVVVAGPGIHATLVSRIDALDSGVSEPTGA